MNLTYTCLDDWLTLFESLCLDIGCNYVICVLWTMPQNRCYRIIKEQHWWYRLPQSNSEWRGLWPTYRGHSLTTLQMHHKKISNSTLKFSHLPAPPQLSPAQLCTFPRAITTLNDISLGTSRSPTTASPLARPIKPGFKFVYLYSCAELPHILLDEATNDSFWSWCYPCFSFGFCHSNLGLCPWVSGIQLALGYLLGGNHSPFYSMLPCFFLPQGGFPKADGRHFTQHEQLLCYVLPLSFFIALPGRSIEFPGQLERMWTQGSF